MDNQLLLTTIMIAVFTICVSIPHSYAKKNKTHDNIVIFQGNFMHISFRLDNYCVSPGQSFGGIKLTRNLSISVKSGRHASSEVAKCLNQWILSSQNTFNHHAKKLNFAMKGTLKIYVNSEDNKFYTFTDMVLAQGHAVISNNWWFGGIHCKYVEKYVLHACSKLPHNVTCQSNEGKEWCFHRGPAFVNHIQVDEGACLI